MHILLPIAVMAAALGQAEQGRPAATIAAQSDQTELERLNATWLNSYVTRDVATLGAILADDFVAVSSGGNQRTKAQLLEGVRSRRAEYEPVHPENVRVHLYGDMAVVTARSVIRARTDAGVTEARNDYADVYVRRNRRWQAVLAHVVRAPTAQADQPAARSPR